MATKKQVFFILLLSLLTVSCIIKSSHAVDCPATRSSGGNIAVYWGQNSEEDEGDLTEACDNGNYTIVLLAYLHISGSEKSLNLDNHCPGGDCTVLASQIEHCQKNKSIQVLLSIEVDEYGISDVNDTATYLLNNFLSGNAGQLGSVTLDGIDLATPSSDYSTSVPWEDLVKAINGSTQERKIYISAGPRCQFLDGGLRPAINTGLFDYIWVVYYNYDAECQYLNGNPANLLESWQEWTSSVLSNNSVYLGLVASSNPAAATSGYIDPADLKSQILPTVKEASNYGGVMLWNRYWDKETGYSAEIKDALGTEQVCECVCRDAVSSSFNILLSRSV